MSSAAPDAVNLLYRFVAGRHVFTCAEINGLYVMNKDLKPALRIATEALSAHATRRFGEDTKYQLTKSVDEISERISSATTGESAVHATLANQPVAA